MESQAVQNGSDDSAKIYLSDISQDLAISAFSGTSFSPERRAVSARWEYAKTMAEDKAKFIAMATQGGTLHLVDEEFERYRAGYAQRYRRYLASSSRCVSSFIAGPSNFPVSRMNRRADIAHNRMGELVAFRERVFRAVRSTLRPDLKPIMAGDADALERYTKELIQLERHQALIKAANAAIRKHSKREQVIALVELGFTDAKAAELLKPDCAGRIGFPSWVLTNNGANIRRVKARIEAVEARAGWQTREVEQAEGVTVREDVEVNRIMLLFPGKPDENARELLKRYAFKWSPRSGAWQRYLNDAGRNAVKQVLAGITANKPTE